MSQQPTATPGWPKGRPSGEDFFLLQMTIDTPSDPDWDEGASAIGSWKQITDAYTSMLALATPLRRRVTFQIYQDRDAVHERLAFSLAEEARFRRERGISKN
jgi:hypothetical protein